MAAIIYSEAGNQGYNGMLAVGSVIMNRVYSRGYGFANVNTITAVVYQKNQFEPASRIKPYYKDGVLMQDKTVLQFYLAYPDKISANAKSAAQAVMNGTRYHWAGGAMNQLFFMTPAAFEKQAWLKGRNIKDKFTLGGHTFFNVL